MPASRSKRRRPYVGVVVEVGAEAGAEAAAAERRLSNAETNAEAFAQQMYQRSEREIESLRQAARGYEAESAKASWVAQQKLT